MNASRVVNDYLERGDAATENANLGFGPNGLLFAVGGKALALDNLKRIEQAGFGELVELHHRGAVHIHDLSTGHVTPYCLTGDTKVRLADGTTPTIKELAEGYAGGTFEVLAQRGEELTVGFAKNPRLTRRQADVVRVKLVGGASFRCTPDHKIMLRDGSWCEAGELKRGARLMPCHLDKSNSGYLYVEGWADGKKFKEYLHRKFMEQALGRKLEPGETVHRFNENKTDNRPENLILMGDVEHRRASLAKTKMSETCRKANAEALAERNRTPAMREVSRATMQENWDRAKEAGNDSLYYNHRVEDVWLEPQFEDVYCMEVEGLQNFILDVGVVVHNCAGHSLSNLLEDGVSSGVVSHPAKHLRTAINHMINFIGGASNEFAGAQAFSDVDVYLAPFAFKAFLDALMLTGADDSTAAMKLAEREVKQSIQELLFHLNHRNRWGGQAPFSNITLAITCPPDMENRPVVVAGKMLYSYYPPEWRFLIDDSLTYGDLGMWQEMVVNAILDTFLEGDAEGNGFTFPVLTVNVTEEFFKHPMRHKIFELSAKFGTPYFQNFINGVSGGQRINPEDVRSMCPMHGDTRVLVKTDHKGISVRRIQDVYGSAQKGTKYKIFHGGAWIEADVVANDAIGMKTIRTTNGAEVVFDERHEQPIKTGMGASVEIVTAKDIRPGMWIPFNAMRDNSGGSREAGFAVGLFIGDGSYQNDTNIVYSLNRDTDQENAARVMRFFELFGFRVGKYEHDNDALMTVRIGGASNGAAVHWMKQFIDGDSATTKAMSQRVFNAGSDFLEGLLDGWYASDGGNRGRIYTSSEFLLNDFESVCALLGKHFRTSRGNPDIRSGRLSDTPGHTLKFHVRPSYANQFFFEDGYWWFPVNSVEEYKTNGNERVYCFVVNSDDHLFALGNGMITHNCRLSINEKEIAKHVGGIFGSAEQTGSLQVITISLPYLAQCAFNADDGIFGEETRKVMAERFFFEVGRVMSLCRDEMLWKREIVNDRFKRGFYSTAGKNFKRGFDTFFTTVGFIGLWEAVEILTGDKDSFLTEPGMELAQNILTFMRGTVEDFTAKTGKLFNLEATPAESACYKLAKKAIRDFPEIPHRGTKRGPYFTNSCHLPVELHDQLDLVFDTQSKLQTIPNGGTVTHFFTGEDMTGEEIETFVKTVCGTKIPYFSITAVYSVCQVHGRIPGAWDYCPKCTDADALELQKTHPELVEA